VSAAAARGDSNAAPKVGKFPRRMRLLRRAEFERVYQQGGRHFSARITVFYWARAQAKTSNKRARRVSGIRVGFTVGRALGGAVERNRIKRRLREAVRLAPLPLKADVDVVINPKKSLLAADFSAVLNEVARAFQIIENKITSKSEPPTPEACS
jgi:ribonuclease P protein component